MTRIAADVVEQSVIAGCPALAGPLILIVSRTSTPLLIDLRLALEHPGTEVMVARSVPGALERLDRFRFAAACVGTEAEHGGRALLARLADDEVATLLFGAAEPMAEESKLPVLKLPAPADEIRTRVTGVMESRAMSELSQPIDDVMYDPETLLKIRQSFDAAWAQVAGDFGYDEDQIQAGRSRLAALMLELGKDRRLDAEQLKTTALRRLARECGTRVRGRSVKELLSSLQRRGGMANDV